MKYMAIILRKPPYGEIHAAEALRHALGAASDDLKVLLLLVDGGVLLAKKGQHAQGAEATDLGAALHDCIEAGVAVRTDKASLRKEHIDEADLVEGVVVVEGSDISELVGGADHALIY